MEKIDHNALGLAAPLPGSELPSPADTVDEVGVPAVFSSLVSAPAVEVEDWRQILRLDTPPGSLRTMGPPAAPPGIEADSGLSRRLRFRRLIRRHARWLEAGAAQAAWPSNGEHDAVAAMVALLAGFQELEDAIAARQMAGSRD